MDKPNGVDLLATLIKLLEEQEGVKVIYQIEKKGESDEINRS